MKKISILFSLLVALFFSVNIMAQEKAKTGVASVKQKGETVRFSLVSSKPFIFANNRYVLYLGEKAFYKNEQWEKKGKGYLTYFIPASEFKQVKEGAKMYLSYGDIDVTASDIEDYAKESRKCWSLGNFNKNLLKK
jgi:hypothetical protein